MGCGHAPLPTAEGRTTFFWVEFWGIVAARSNFFGFFSL